MCFLLTEPPKESTSGWPDWPAWPVWHAPIKEAVINETQEIESPVKSNHLKTVPPTPAFAEKTPISDALVVKTQSTPIETEPLSEETCTDNSIALTNQAAELPIMVYYCIGASERRPIRVFW